MIFCLHFVPKNDCSKKGNSTNLEMREVSESFEQLYKFYKRGDDAAAAAAAAAARALLFSSTTVSSVHFTQQSAIEVFANGPQQRRRSSTFMPISGLYRKTHCCAVKPEIRKRLYHRSPILTIAGAVTLLMSRIRLCSRYSCPARKLCLVTWSHLLTTYNACAISKHAKSKEHYGHLSLINLSSNARQGYILAWFCYEAGKYFVCKLS